MYVKTRQVQIMIRPPINVTKEEAKKAYHIRVPSQGLVRRNSSLSCFYKKNNPMDQLRCHKNLFPNSLLTQLMDNTRWFTIVLTKNCTKLSDSYNLFTRNDCKH